MPVIGGNLLAVLPLGPDGTCSCTPGANDILSTSTALAEHSRVLLGYLPDVCIVRLKISRDTVADVNQDQIVNTLDIETIEEDKAYTMDPDAPSNCTGPCGRADVNGDGRVNILDATAVAQSAVSGQNVSCGAVYATAFSCGPLRAAPATPAMSISLDTVFYFNSDGMTVEGQDFQNQRRRRTEFYEKLVGRVGELESKQDYLTRKTEKLESKDQQQRSAIDETAQISSSSSGVVVDVMISVGVVVFCVGIAMLVRKSQ